MKNVVKITVILGVTISVLTFHSTMAQEIHTLERDKLESINPLENMEDLSISPRGCFQGHGEDFYKKKLDGDKGLPTFLTAIKFLEGRDSVKNKETLKTIQTAVSRGVPVESHYYPCKDAVEYEDDFHILHSQKPVSISRLIEGWCKKDFSIDKIKQGALESTISQGQQERLACICDKWIAGIRSKFGIDISEDLMLLILSLSGSYKDDEQRMACTKQTEQKCLQKQQPQVALLNKSLSGGNSYQWMSFCPLKKLLQWCIALAKNQVA